MASEIYRPDASGAGFGHEPHLFVPSSPEATRPPTVDEIILRVSPLVAQTAAWLKGLTNGAGIKSSDLGPYRVLFDRRVTDLGESLTPVNLRTDIQERPSQVPSEIWPVLIVTWSLGEKVPDPFPKIDPSQTTIKDLITAGSISYPGFASLVDVRDVERKRYANYAKSEMTVPVISIGNGQIINTSSYPIRF